MPRRTLERRLQEAHLPTAHLIITWCRLLYAGWALGVLKYPVKRVIQELGFSSAQTLYYLFKHYAGVTPRESREAEGFHFLLRQFDTLLQSASSS